MSNQNLYVNQSRIDKKWRFSQFSLAERIICEIPRKQLIKTVYF